MLKGRGWKFWVVASFAAVVGFGAVGNLVPDPEPSSTAVDLTDSSQTSAAPTADASSEPPAPVLLFVTDLKDGDSWDASDGGEYRLGMVNAPEVGENCFAEAASFTSEFVKEGFTVDDYSTDTYGRHVAEVFDTSGDSLNVAFAKSGLGDDRYLAEFRHENLALAEKLEAAYASAPTPSCKPLNKPVPLVQKPAKAPKKDCMDGYSPCLPIRADMDCPEIGHSVTVTGNDPYRLDRDGDGIGCD